MREHPGEAQDRRHRHQGVAQGERHGPRNPGLRDGGQQAEGVDQRAPAPEAQGARAAVAARDPDLMRLIRDAGVTLEICPTSNLLTKALADEEQVRETFQRFVEHGVAFTIATDGPEMMRTHLRDDFALLERIGALSAAELDAANARGHAATFVRA